MGERQRALTDRLGQVHASASRYTTYNIQRTKYNIKRPVCRCGVAVISQLGPSLTNATKTNKHTHSST